MRVETARWLTSVGRQWLNADLDPDSFADAQRLRKDLDAERAAAVLQQVALRRKAKAKFAEQAGELFFTSAALEQATRPQVAAWRAAQFRDAGARRVVDLGCGIGADSLAMIRAGLDVRPIELDEVTAIFAEANLGRAVEVVDAQVVDLGNDAVFCDPARRTSRGRSWRVEDFSPPWEFVRSLLSGRIACLKLGPGVPYSLIPDAAATTWVSHNGDVVEASLWSVGEPGSRTALLLPSGFTIRGGAAQVTTRAPEPGDLLLEPDGAIIRAGLVDELAAACGAQRVGGVAYLLAQVVPDEMLGAGAVTAFRVEEILPYSEKVLRAWVREHDIGVLEIKKRGLQVDPAALRQRLRPRGAGSATLVLTPSSRGALALVVSRLSAPSNGPA